MISTKKGYTQNRFKRQKVSFLLRIAIFSAFCYYM